MLWYRVRLRIEPATDPSPEQLAALDEAGSPVRRRSDHVSVTLEHVNAGDPAGALARAQNVVLDHVAGEIRAGDVELTEPPEQRPGRRTKRR